MRMLHVVSNNTKQSGSFHHQGPEESITGHKESVFEDRVLLLLTLKPGYKQPHGPLSESASCIEDTIAVNNQETQEHKRRE